MEIFGKSLYLSIAFNLTDPVGSLKVGADSSTEWYKNKMNKENPTDTSENYYDNPNPHVDFQLSGKMWMEARNLSIHKYVLVVDHSLGDFRVAHL